MGDPGKVDLKMEHGVLLHIFKKLSTTDLSSASLVCKSWNSVSQDPVLWYAVKLINHKITSNFLSLIVQRQPLKLVLNFCGINKGQMNWLFPRLPQTKMLSL